MGDDDVIVDGDQPRHGHHREAETCTDQNRDQTIVVILGIRPAAANMCGEMMHTTISVALARIIERERKSQDSRYESVS